MTIHRDLPDSELHETKGISGASSGDVIVADGAGGSAARKLALAEVDSSAVTARDIIVSNGTIFEGKTSSRMGWANYQDTATTGTPIVLTPTATFVNMTNDGLGTRTNTTFLLPEVTKLWDAATNSIDLSELVIGDTVDIRIDMDVTTTGANHEIESRIDMDTTAIDVNFPLLLVRENFKTAGTFKLVRFYSLFVGSQAIIDGVHKLQVRSDTGTTDSVIVDGWYIRAITRSNY